MFGEFLNDGNEDQTDKAVRDIPLPYNKFDMLDQIDGNDCDDRDSDRQGENTLRKSKLLFLFTFILMLLVLLLFKDGVIDTLVRPDLEIDIDDVGYDEEARCDT